MHSLLCQLATIKAQLEAAKAQVAEGDSAFTALEEEKDVLEGWLVDAEGKLKVAEDEVWFLQALAASYNEESQADHDAPDSSSSQGVKALTDEQAANLVKIDSLEQELFEVRGGTCRPPAISPGVRILQLADNPETRWAEMRQATLDRLKILRGQQVGMWMLDKNQ
ncbi:hypothetical protein H0H92_001447, partial [Tricholoma furcatifolium]